MTTEPLLNPEDLLALAQELVSRGNTASRRSAVDRAYYAVFLYNRDTLRAQGLYTPTDDARDHGSLPGVVKAAVSIEASNDQMRLRFVQNTYTYVTTALPPTAPLPVSAGLGEELPLATAEHWLNTARNILQATKVKYP